jgi:hypothetical protein
MRSTNDNGLWAIAVRNWATSNRSPRLKLHFLLLDSDDVFETDSLTVQDLPRALPYAASSSTALPNALSEDGYSK